MMEGSTPMGRPLVRVQVQLFGMDMLAQVPNSFPGCASLGMETDAGMVSV